MGEYPLQAVQMMASIVLEAEATMRVQQLSPPKIIQSSRFDLSIADSAVYAAYDLNSNAIVAVCKVSLSFVTLAPSSSANATGAYGLSVLLHLLLLGVVGWCHHRMLTSHYICLNRVHYVQLLL
jgi:hypothetical protein